ncbi:hypothetical protein MSG28_006622 [Choristoneura fumiferana]|uniref:Uncharacterized protein n=1 Tax=Choristoneura fumiferana TaxID=7141 RepID=A0ACC0JFH1_CHOFU|nr:hypothetical protein MSG28_006622 [Choristoneura fumiferana]
MYLMHEKLASSVSNVSYLHNPGSEPLVYATIGQALEATAHRFPGRVAVRSVYQDADALGCALRDRGLEKGDRIALNPVYEKPELKYCINKTELKAIIIGDTLKHANYYKVIEDLIPEVRRDVAGSIESKEFPSLKCIITYSSRYGFQVEPDDGSIIHFTSGTTGEPKAALDSHFGVVNNSYFLGKRQKLNEGHPVTCIQSPLFHALGSIITAAAALRHGASLVLPAPSYSVSANMHALMAENAGVTPRLRDALNAGAPCSPQLIRDIKQFLNAETVSSLFGMTETTAAVFQSLPNDNTELVAETVGYIQDHIETKVVDDEGKTVPFGSPGELLVRGYSTMMGYWGEPEKTRKTLGADGWLHTGDKFTLNEDGYGRIVGRLKDIIVRGGENIAPKEIEDLLNTHPDIVESQVVGVSDERLGEELCAVVRLREGASLTPQDVQRHCTGRLAKFKIPRILKFAEEFPKTVSGKIQKYKLRDLIESGKL